MKTVDTLTTAGTAFTASGAVNPPQDITMQIVHIAVAIVTGVLQIISLFKNRNK